MLQCENKFERFAGVATFILFFNADEPAVAKVTLGVAGLCGDSTNAVVVTPGIPVGAVPLFVFGMARTGVGNPVCRMETKIRNN